MRASLQRCKPRQAKPKRRTRRPPSTSLCFSVRLDPLPVFTTELLSRCWDTSQALRAKDARSNKQTKAGALGTPTSHQHKCETAGREVEQFRGWKNAADAAWQLKEISRVGGFRPRSVKALQSVRLKSESFTFLINLHLAHAALGGPLESILPAKEEKLSIL